MHAAPAARPRRRIDLSGRSQARSGPWARRLALVGAGFAVGLAGLVALDSVPAPPAQITAVRTAGEVGAPGIDLVGARPAAPAAPALAPPPPPDAPPGTPAASADDLVPVAYLPPGGTLWWMARARVGRDLRAILAWIGEVQILNNLADPDRVEPGPLVLPQPDAAAPIFLRRSDLPPQR